MFKYGFTLFFLTVALLASGISAQAAATHVVISQVQLGGTSSTDEWIELYNPTESPVALNGWRLTRKTAGGTEKHESILVSAFPNVSIPAHGFFLIAHANYFGQTPADLNYSNTSNSVANNNTVLLYSDAGQTVIDKVGFGTAIDREGTTAPNPEDKTASARQPGGNLGSGQDTDDNSADFLIQSSPQPRNSASAPAPVLAVVVINEILPDPNEGAAEAIELFSPTASDVTGWTLSDSTGNTIATLSGSINQFLVVTLSGAKLNNPGDTIVLKNNAGGEQDRMSYGDQDGATKPSKGETLIRLPDGADTNADASDWHTTNQPTLGAANQALSTIATPPPAASEPAPVPPPSSAPGIILISEFVSDPTDDEDEWIELFSQSADPINLDGWMIEDGSEAQTKLSGTIAPQGYAIVNKPKGSLNNASDRIVLLDPTQTIIDSVSYGFWLDGNVDDNAPKTTDPNSSARSHPYIDTGTDSTDFKITTTPTKNAHNIITEPLPVSSGSVARRLMAAEQNPDATLPKISFTGQLVISEVFPNPAGDDSKTEFVEIHNVSPQEITLTGLKIQDAADEFVISDQPFVVRLRPDGYLAFRREQTRIALNNTGQETVRLRNPDNSPVDEISYSGSAQENTSLVRDQRGDIFWTTIPTPDAINSAVRKNIPPAATIHPPTALELNQPLVFDGSDSRDSDGAITSFEWRVDRKSVSTTSAATIIFTNPGDHVVTLTVTDNQGADHKATWRGTLAPAVMANEEIPSESPAAAPLAPTLFESSAIRLSELLPNPAGSDNNEWIELVNADSVPAALAGWSLATANTTKPFFFTSESVPANGFLVLGRERTRLTLNNTEDHIKLFAPQQTLIDEAAYQKAPSGASLVRDEQNRWQWTQTPTPNLLNTITTEAVTLKESAATAALETTLAELAELDLDTPVKIEGLITAPPDVLGKHTIYVSDDTAGSQIYLSNGLFPQLALGTRVRVQGIVRQNQGERRILVRAPEQIQILDKTAEPKPTVVTAASLAEASSGQLVQISGQVTQKRGNAFVVDDGSDETNVYVKASTGIKQPLSAGDSVTIAGIVSHTSAGLRLLPRLAADIKVGEVAGARVITLPDRTVTGGGGELFTLSSPTTTDPTQKYLLAFLALSTLLFAGLWWRDRKENTKPS